MAEGIDPASSEDLLREVFSSVQDGISILDPDLNIVRVNHVMEEWYRDRFPLVGRKCYEVYHGKDRPCRPCPTIRCMQTGQTECEIVPGPADSPIRWIELYSHPVTDPETGRITGVAEFVRDMTQRMNALEDLRLLADQAQATFDAMSDAVFNLDTEGRILRCNRAALDFIGGTADQLIGRKCRDLVSEVSGVMPDCPFERMMESGNSETQLLEIRGRWYDSRIDPIRDSSGGIEGAVHVFRDITDIKTLEGRQLFTARLFSRLPLVGDRRQIIRQILEDVRDNTGVEAVGLRLADGEDFPYFETVGFGSGFVEHESLLCMRTRSGGTATDGSGAPVLECICGSVLRGALDTSRESVTGNESFWTGSLTGFLERSSGPGRELLTRSGCIGEGYESLALIPLRADGDTIGLLQLSDRRSDFFSTGTIAFLENVSSALGVAIARSINSERWRSLTEYSPDYIMLLDRQGRIRFTNRTIPGLAVEDVVGRHLTELTPAEYRETIGGVLEGVLETGEPGTCETIYMTDDRAPGHFHVRVAPVWDAGRIVSLVCTSTDITHRRETELALLHSEERLKLALMGTAEGIWDCPDPDSDEEWWSPRYYQLLGYTEGEIEASRESLFRLLHPDDREWVSEAIRGSIEESESFDVEYRLLCRSGDYRWFRSRARIQRDDDGRPVRITGTLADINERKIAELALKESEENYRSIFNSVYSAIFVHDAESGRLLDMNRRASELLGLGIEEVQAIPLDEYLERLFGTDAEKMSGITDLVLSGHPQQQERRLSTPDGRELWVHVYLQLATVAGKNRILAILRDITDIRNAEREKKKLESQMQHAQKLESLGILAGGIAHDFNNILVGILGNADLALMDLPPEHPAYGSVKDIENSSRRASELVRQMLAYSGKGKFQTGMIDLSRVVEEMTHMLEVSVSKKAQLRFDLAGDLLPVECDVTQIRQVLMNLVINASESLESGSGLITIRTSSAYCDREYLASTYIDENLREGHYCCIEVSDTGSGIAPEIRSQLFDPFFTTKVTGRGLGLAAVLGIVRSHAGAISVYSEVGRGTTFKILLPAGEKTGREDDGSGEAAGAASTWKGAGTVLLVDDEQGVLQVGSRMLEKMGFAVLTAPDGFEAVSILRDRGEDIVCVILDLTMPRLDGAETLDEILKFDRNAKVILCSGYSEQDVSHRFVGRGFAGFMHKPYGSEDLAAVLKKVLGD